MVTNSNSQTVSAWGIGQKYIAGQFVTYDGVTYQALVAETAIATWNPEATPSLWLAVSASAASAPAAQSSSTDKTAPAWTATSIYTAGMTASENRITYQANWWTQNNDPAHSNGGAGSGQPWTIVTSGSTPTPVPVPTTPTGLAASATSTTSTSLAWTAASVTGGGTVTGYAVFEDGVQIATTAGLTYTVGGLTPATTYHFSVDAIDATGASAQSAPVTVTTTTPVPTPPPVDGVAAWSVTTVYTAGMQASEAGAVYQANWWSEGNDPVLNNAPVGQGQPWTFVAGVAPPPPLASVPTGLTALGTTNTATLLTWTASAVPNNGTVTGYAVFENGAQIGTASGPSYVLTGLSGNTTYTFSVEALDNAGASAQSPTLSVTTAAPVGSVSQVYSPYVDMSLFVDENLLAISQASGLTNFTLAFIQSSGPDTIGWAGTGTIDQDTQPNGISIQSEVQTLRAEGGKITISFGGENGTDPATVASSAAALQAEYQSVITRYGVTSLDFDIEGAPIANTASMHLRDEALTGLKAANPGLTISFTLPVLPTGLDSNGLHVLQVARADGLNPDTINVMAMDYGASVDQGGEMGVDAISAAIYTQQQIQFVGLTSKVGITPMIGLNDTPGETFTLADAQMVTAFAQGNPAIASLGNWSVARDNGATAGVHYVSPDSSGLAQTPFEFASIFKGV